MKANVKNSPISIRIKPLDGKRIQIVVFESNTGLEYIHVLDYTKPINQKVEFEASSIIVEEEKGERNDD